MKILCFDTAEALAKAAAGEIASLLRQKPDCAGKGGFRRGIPR